MKRLKLFGILTLVILVLIVILQNTEEVRTNLLFMEVTMPRALLLLVTLLIGLVVGILVARRLRRSAK